MEPKNADLIYCIDSRDEKNKKYMTFNLMMDEIYNLEDSKFFDDSVDKLEYSHVIEKIKLIKSLPESTEDERKEKQARIVNLEKSIGEGKMEELWEEYKDKKLAQLKQRREFLKHLPDKVKFMEKPEDYDKPECNPQDKQNYDDYLEKKKEYDKVKFFRIKGADLDDERREVTDGMDLLTFLRGGN